MLTVRYDVSSFHHDSISVGNGFSVVSGVPNPLAIWSSDPVVRAGFRGSRVEIGELIDAVVNRVVIEKEEGLGSNGDSNLGVTYPLTTS